MDTRFTPAFDGFCRGRDVLFHRPSSCPYWVSPYRARRQALAGIPYAAASLDRPIKGARPQVRVATDSLFKTAKRTHARVPATRRARDFAQKFRAVKSADSVGWAKRSVPTAFALMTWWARRKGAFAHPTNWNFKQ